MDYASLILPEFEQEMASTRKVLERIPEEKLDWRPHPKSNTIGWNANHLAEMAGWVAGTIDQDEWDISPPGGEPYRSPDLKSTQEILDEFDRNVASAKRAIASTNEDHMSKTWSLLNASQPMLTMPRAAVIRTFVLNHIIHHRAILTVYLRLNDIPVPGMYGPSGDD